MHGTVGNPVYDLAKKEGLMEEEEKWTGAQDETFGRMVFVKEGGEEVDEQVLEDVVSAYDDVLEELEQGRAAQAGSAEDYIRYASSVTDAAADLLSLCCKTKAGRRRGSRQACGVGRRRGEGLGMEEPHVCVVLSSLTVK